MATEAPVKSEKVNKKEARRIAAEAREKGAALRNRARGAEAEVARLTTRRSAVERAMFDPSAADSDPSLSGLTMTELMKLRAEIEGKIESAERAWLDASEALETIGAC